MAEIILPPEENEETPQVPELSTDKPTENSKVITIEFEAKKTNKVSTKDTNQQLYATDTDAWFEFKETSLEGANGTYSVVFRNRHDGSIFQRTGDVVNGVAYYKIPHQEIRHAGAWRGQVVYTLSNGDTTARAFDYDVKGHILDGKDVREIVVEDFETLMAQLRSMKDNVELELANLTQELRVTNDTAEQNEANRQAFFNDLVEDIDDLQANYQELLDTGVLQTNINTRLEQLEEEYAPKLTEVTAQLAQTQREAFRKRGLEDLEPEVISAIEGGEGTSFDLLSIPQEGSVTPKTTTFLKTIVGKNLFDKSKVEKNRNINEDGAYFNSVSSDLSDFIPVKPSTVYSAYGHTGNRIHEFNVNEEHVKTTLSTSTITTTPETAYIRIAVPNSGDWLDRAMVVEGSSIPDYEPYEEFYKIENLIVDGIDEEPIPNDPNQTYLHDKKIAIIGDSITADNRYIPTVEERIGTVVLNQGIGGTRVAKMGDDIDYRSMVERSKHQEATVTFDTRALMYGDLNHDEGTISMVLNDANPRYISKWLKLGASGEGSWNLISTIEPENVDIMAILHGTNDYSNGVPLGDIDSLDEFTFYGAYNKTIENILNRNHNVKLMLITPLWRVTAYDNNPIGLTLVDYVKAVKNIAEKYNLPCLDLFSTSGINEHNYTTMFGDRIHPNATGGVRIGNIIASFILNGY